LPRLRQAASRDRLVLGGALLQSATTVVVAYSSQVSIIAVAMFLSGIGWITTVNSLSVSVQLALPDWVRARGMSIFQMSVMGASALGAAVWGQVATLYTVHTSLVIAAVSGTAVMLGVHWLVEDRSIEEDLTPSRALKAPVAAIPPVTGHVQVCIEYWIDPARADDFLVLMQESRRSRLRQGALAWELLHDIADPGRYVEQIVDESWTEHLRRFDRVTSADVALRERKLAFHIGEAAPIVTRYVVKDI
jgi:MFS family permease